MRAFVGTWLLLRDADVVRRKAVTRRRPRRRRDAHSLTERVVAMEETVRALVTLACDDADDPILRLRALAAHRSRERRQHFAAIAVGLSGVALFFAACAWSAS